MILIMERRRVIEWHAFSLFTNSLFLVTLIFDESFHLLTTNVIAELLGRRLEEIGRRSNDRPAEFAVQADPGAADGVDHHARRVGAVPHFELHFDVEGNIAKG